ncbi:MAG: 3-dehydroquinate synthase [Clostridiales bacterium]|nr:3-dehydroquinate synthase [Clostridiales bacterium]
MKTIKVNASKSYDILLGSGLLNNIGSYVTKVISSKKIVIVTENNVNAIYGEQVAKNLEESGFEVYIWQFLAGEQSKNAQVYFELITFIANCSLQRNDCLLALGGGVVGDLCGFAASTYMRGIKFISVPTTLLAIIDSSVGGKTAIDLEQGKNLVGTFYQPDLVIADIDTLSTLPHREIINGKGELIKYGILLGGKLWQMILTGSNPLDNACMLELCIKYKRDIVERDEHEKSLRKLLNLGHTAGHAIEKITNYAMPHGECVALGIAIAARSAYARKELSFTSYEQIMSVLKAENMPLIIDIKQENIINAALNDKKRAGKELTMVVINDIGNCQLRNVPIQSLGEYFVCK